MAEKPEVPEKIWISPHDIKMILSHEYANILVTDDSERKGKTGIEFIPKSVSDKKIEDATKHIREVSV